MNHLVVWLDQSRNDFEIFRKKFLISTKNSDVFQWIFHSADDESRRTLEKAILSSKEIILITSGRLGIDLIIDFHSHQQLHSIYIYCQNISKYKRFSQSYPKILGIFSDPNDLLRSFIENFSKKFSKTDDDEEKFPFEQNLIEWKPWQNEFPVEKLSVDDPTIISIVENDFIPWKIIFSPVEQLKESFSSNKLSIHVDFQRNSLTIGTFLNGEIHLRSSNRQIDENQDEMKFWIVFSKRKSKVFVGIGEIRLDFVVLQTDFSPSEKIYFDQLEYFHFCLNGFWKNLSRIENFDNRIRLSFGSFQLIQPDLLIRSERKSDGLSSGFFNIEKFPLPLKKIFLDLSSFKLVDLDFPHFISAIDASCRQSDGFCRQILQKTNSKTNSIRLNQNSFSIEIFPSDFSTSIRNFRNSSGFIRVLHGSILIRLYRSLTSKSPKEFLLHKDDVTWFLPHWNQTQQMKNIELNSLTIILQFIQSNSTVRNQNEILVEFFDGETQKIRQMTKTFDLSFDEFKEKMRDEWNKRH